MRAWADPVERLGDPEHAMQLEQIEVAPAGPGEVLAAATAAGVNYNACSAAMGLPLILPLHGVRPPHRRLAVRASSSARPGRNPLGARGRSL